MKRKEILWLRDVNAKDELNNHLTHYNLSVFSGDIICLVCPSPLLKKLISNVILGNTLIDNGDIYVTEELCKKYNSRDAYDNGILSSHGTNRLVETMTIEHNLFALRDRKNPFKIFNQQTARIQTKQILNILGLDDIKNKRVRDLNPYQKQMVGIAKSVINHAKVIVVENTSLNYSVKELKYFINNIKKYAIDGTSFIIMCDEVNNFMNVATRIQYVSESNQIFDFNDVEQFQNFLITSSEMKFMKQKKLIVSKDAQPFILNTHINKMIKELKDNDPIIYEWEKNNTAKIITGSINRYLIPKLSLIDNLCLGLYKKISTFGVINKKLSEFTFHEALNFANITDKNASIQMLSPIQKLLLVIYRESLKNASVIVLDNAFLELDENEINLVIEALDSVLDKGIIIYFREFRNLSSFKLKENVYSFDYKRAIMIKKDTFS